MDAIFFFLRTGCLNATGICSSSSAHRRFKEWHDSGIFERFWQNGLLACEHLDSIDWSWLSMDGCMTKSPLSGTKTGRNPKDKGKQGVKRSLLTDAGASLSLVVAAANTHDIKLVADTLDALQAGHPGETQALSGQRLRSWMAENVSAESPLRATYSVP
jgi:hypothetical protein